jgi:hypothetical protein
VQESVGVAVEMEPSRDMFFSKYKNNKPDTPKDVRC